MRYVMCLFLVCCMVFCGCEQLKGKQGDSGTPAVAYSKEYSGYPNSNPYNVMTDKPIDLETDIIEVYVTEPTNKIAMKCPTSVNNYYHYYGIDVDAYSYYKGIGKGLIKLATANNTGTDPTKAFSDFQNNYYKVIHKKFNTAAACIAYKSQYKLDTSPLNTIIWGREVN